MASLCRAQIISPKALLAIGVCVIAGALPWAASNGVVHADGARKEKALLGKPKRVLTGSPLDLFIAGRGFFQVELADGRTAYTRDGSFRLSANGQIVTEDGYLLQPGISVPSDYVEVSVGLDGLVAARQGESATLVNLGQLQLAAFMNVDGLDDTHPSGFLLETEDSGPPVVGQPGQEGLGYIEQGFLEGVGDEWVNELFRLIAESELDVGSATPVQSSDGVKQLLIVVNLR